MFTAGIGENSSVIREKICDGLEFLGIELDLSKNAKAIGTEMAINKPFARTAVLVVPTDEELMIARYTVETLGL